MTLSETFGTDTALIGMVHLSALPGAPAFSDRQSVRSEALADAIALSEAGFDGIIVENFGDKPFYPETVPPHTVAEFTATVRELTLALDCPVGINVLRNDAQAALAIAAATEGSFIRVNVHTGVRDTDQGLLSGRAHKTLRLREQLETSVSVLADIAVKHSAALTDRPLAAVARETIDRGLADGIIVSGPETGADVSTTQLETVLSARDEASRDVPVFVGSGVTHETVGELCSLVDGVIVGTALKRDGKTTAPVDPERAAAFVEQARSFPS